MNQTDPSSQAMIQAMGRLQREPVGTVNEHWARATSPEDENERQGTEPGELGN